MRRRAFVLLCGTLALAACGGNVYEPPVRPYAPPAQPSPLAENEAGPVVSGRTRAAILLPLTGPRADIGQALLQAAQLALPDGGAPALDARDTGGTPEGAAAAARAAIDGGAGIILGPLTSTETAAVAPIAAAAGVPVLAFTNDPNQARPGVWPLGVTPLQQVRRLVVAAQAQNKSTFAALLPDSDFGRAMANALTQVASNAGAAAPNIVFHATGMAAINGAARDISAYGSRRAGVDARIKAARLLGTREGRIEAQDLAKTAVPPPPFDTLLLADTKDDLAELAAVLPYYYVDPSAVQIIGPALWSAPASGSGAVPGAWYAAPDPAARTGFEQSYTARYNTPPPPIADLAFDAASIARVLASHGSYPIGALTQPGGFAGVDGWLALEPDGHARRALGVFRIERGGAQMIEPAPTGAGAPGT